MVFVVPSAPSWSRRMAALPGSGSDGGFFLLKGSRFSPQSPHAHSGGGLDRMISVGFLSKEIAFELALYV